MTDFKNQSPWGTPPGGGGSGNGGFRKGPTPPNIDEVISKLLLNKVKFKLAKLINNKIKFIN